MRERERESLESIIRQDCSPPRRRGLIKECNFHRAPMKYSLASRLHNERARVSCDGIVASCTRSIFSARNFISPGGERRRRRRFYPSLHPPLFFLLIDELPSFITLAKPDKISLIFLLPSSISCLVFVHWVLAGEVSLVDRMEFDSSELDRAMCLLTQLDFMRSIVQCTREFGYVASFF